MTGDAKARIRESAAPDSDQIRYRDIADLLPQPIFEIDLAGTVTYVNEQSLDVFGYSKEEVAAGLNAIDLFAPGYLVGQGVNSGH